MYGIQALLLPVKDIVDEQRYWASSVEAQETDLFHHLLKMTFNIITFNTRHAIITQYGMTTLAQLTKLAKIWRPKNLNFNWELWPVFSNLLRHCALSKMLGAQQPAYKKTYRETYNRYSVFYAHPLNDNMREMPSSPLSKNFNISISHKCFGELGKHLKVFSRRDSVIPPRNMSPIRSRQMESEHATPKEYESVVEE